MQTTRTERSNAPTSLAPARDIEAPGVRHLSPDTAGSWRGLLFDDQLILAYLVGLIAAFVLIIIAMGATRSIALSAFGVITLCAAVTVIARTVLRATDVSQEQPSEIALHPHINFLRARHAFRPRSSAPLAPDTHQRRRRNRRDANRSSAERLRSVNCRHEPGPDSAHTIVVGYDGSSGARAAVIEAARLAGRNGHVFVVHAYAMPPGYLGAPYFNNRLSNARRRGAIILSDLLQKHRDELPPTNYVDELLGGPPANAINNVADARNADQIVIGTSRRRLTPILGSISHKLARIAAPPVLIIPALTPPHQDRHQLFHRHPKRPTASPTGWPDASHLEPPWS